MFVKIGHKYLYGEQAIVINRILAIDTEDNMIIANCQLKDDYSINMSMRLNDLKDVSRI